MKTMKMTTMWWCVSAMVWTIAACGGGDDQTPQNTTDAGPDADVGIDVDPDVSPELTSCTPDPALLAERIECLSDDMCPCGTFCSLGLCTYECTTDADCADGEVCGRFGTCRAPEDINAILAPTSSPIGGLRSLQASRVMVADAIVSIPIVADTALERARISARRSAKVRCPGESEFSEECTLNDLGLEAGDELSVDVQLDENAPPEDIAELVIFTDNAKQNISLPTIEQLPGHLSTEEIAALAAPLQGRYRGSLRLVDAGARQGENLRDTAVIPLAIEVDATLWEGSAGEAIIQIDAPLNVLSAEAGVIGSLTYDTATGRGSASLPITRLLDVTVAGQTSANPEAPQPPNHPTTKRTPPITHTPPHTAPLWSFNDHPPGPPPPRPLHRTRHRSARRRRCPLRLAACAGRSGPLRGAKPHPNGRRRHPAPRVRDRPLGRSPPHRKGARARAVVYTSGEHCPMCAAAHGWEGLGRIVYASSSRQLVTWLGELGAPENPVQALPITEILRNADVDGPVEGLDEEVRRLHIRHATLNQKHE